MSVGRTTGSPARSAATAAVYDVHLPSTTRSRPTDPASTRTSRDSRAPRAARRPLGAWPSPTSSTSPAGLSTSRAPSATSSRNARPRRAPRAAPSPAPRAAARRRPPARRTAGSRRRGRTALAAARRPGRPGRRRRDRRGRCARRSRRRAQRLLRTTSIAVTVASGRSSAIASAIAPVPVPTSSTSRLLDAVEQLEAALDDDLRLGPRDQRALVDGERQPAEAPLAEDVRERLPRAPPPHELAAGRELVLASARGRTGDRGRAA